MQESTRTSSQVQRSFARINRIIHKSFNTTLLHLIKKLKSKVTIVTPRSTPLILKFNITFFWIILIYIISSCQNFMIIKNCRVVKIIISAVDNPTRITHKSITYIKGNCQRSFIQSLQKQLHITCFAKRMITCNTLNSIISVRISANIVLSLVRQICF